MSARWLLLAIFVVVVVVPAIGHADPQDVTPCEDSVSDPIVTPVRDGQLDAQRGACLRNETSGGLRAHALVDTPGFHGLLGGELELGHRMIVKKAHELSASLTFIDYSFAQTAVNKSSEIGFGPVMIGGAAGGAIGGGARGAVSLRLELPLTHHNTDTVRTSAQLLGLVSGALSTHVVLHARLGPIVRITSSLGGETYRLATVAGADLAWHVRPRLALQAGVDVMAGWDRGLDHVLARAGVQWRLRGGAWRLRAGAGVPVAGHEMTNAIVDLALVVDR